MVLGVETWFDRMNKLFIMACLVALWYLLEMTWCFDLRGMIHLFRRNVQLYNTDNNDIMPRWFVFVQLFIDTWYPCVVKSCHASLVTSRILEMDNKFIFHEALLPAEEHLQKVLKCYTILWFNFSTSDFQCHHIHIIMNLVLYKIRWQPYIYIMLMVE